MVGERTPDFILYTDAASTHCMIASLVFEGAPSYPMITQLRLSHAPRFWARNFHEKNTIFGLELLASLAPIWGGGKKPSGENLLTYI